MIRLMIKFSKKAREKINKKLPTLGEKFDSHNLRHQVFATVIVSYVLFLFFVVYSNSMNVTSFASGTIVAETIPPIATPTPTVPIASSSASVGLKYSIASLSAKIASGGVGIKAFDLTSTGAHQFELYTPTPSVGIRYSPSSGNITPGSSIPIYVYADSAQAPGIYSGTIYNSSDLNQALVSTGIPTNIILASGSADTDIDGFSNQVENYINTDPNYKCTDPKGISAWPPDFNNDGKVTVADTLIVRSKFGTFDHRYDLNMDGKVTIADILMENSYFGKSCQ